jgi:hypothetical protein
MKKLLELTKQKKKAEALGIDPDAIEEVGVPAPEPDCMLTNPMPSRRSDCLRPSESSLKGR